MFKFRTIGQIEHGNYPFEDAVVDKEVMNGAFGDVSSGKFTASDSGKKIIMQVEVGDDEYMDKYKIPAGSHVRVLDPAKVVGEPVTFTNAPSLFPIISVIVKQPTVSITKTE